MADTLLDTESLKENGNPEKLGRRILAKFKDVLIIDLEAVPNGDIFHIGAVFKGNTFEKKELKDSKAGLKELSDFSSGAGYILGHNIINHDMALIKDVFLPMSCPGSGYPAVILSFLPG